MDFIGIRKSQLLETDVPNVECKTCSQTTNQKIIVDGNYYHFLGIPLFAAGKKSTATCSNCNHTIDENLFTRPLRAELEQNNYRIVRPVWHFSSIGIAAILGMIWIAFMLSQVKPQPIDPRASLLQQDLQATTKEPDMLEDSIAYKIKYVLDGINEDLPEKNEIRYLTRLKHNKVLFLMQVPQTNPPSSDERKTLIEGIEMLLDAIEDSKGAEKYIGIKGNSKMLIVKTPTYNQLGKYANEQKLYDFYNP